jgi:hypothetical protein
MLLYFIGHGLVSLAILRSADPELVRQEAWAHLAVHHCTTRIIMRPAAQERIAPDRISFDKVLKHVRRSVIRQSAQTALQIRQFMATMAAKAGPASSATASGACARPTGSSDTGPRAALFTRAVEPRMSGPPPRGASTAYGGPVAWGQAGGAKNSSAIPSGSRKETPEP